MGVLITKLIETFNLKVISEGDVDCEVNAVESNRCGLQLTGYYNKFEEKRIQLIGNAESEYLHEQPLGQRVEAMVKLITHNIPCVILTNDNDIELKALEVAKEKKRWVLGTEVATSRFMVDLTLFLQMELAESVSVHGVLVDVYGVGVLITGKSGMGKSETAIDLIRRGHLLVADDAVVIKKISNDLLVGTAFEMTRNLIECRGIGIVNVNSLFGKSAIRKDIPVEIVMNLTKWDENHVYDRLNGEQGQKSILGINLPCLEIPVQPGRNISAIIEIGVLNHRQNSMGYNTAKELSTAIENASHL